jgi:hypothetical protein
MESPQGPSSAIEADIVETRTITYKMGTPV